MPNSTFGRSTRSATWGPPPTARTWFRRRDAITLLLVIKRSLGPGAHKRLRRECAILVRLAGVAEVVRLGPAGSPDTLVLLDGQHTPVGLKVLPR